MKRFILHFACLIFLLSTALHASAFTSDGIDYTILSEQAVSVSGPNNYTGDLVIPERVTYDGTTYIVESIWTLAFGNCWGLTSVTLPNSMITIGHSAFYGCSNLTSVTIPNSVVTIGDQAFGLCSGLASVTIGESVETIGSEAFFFCTSLASVTIPASVTTIGSDVFFFCSNLTGIEVASGNSAYCSIDGVLYNKEVSHLIQCPQTKECVNIPATVTEIESSAFSNCLKLTSVTLPETVKKIGDRAFMASGLTAATIPESVKTIGTAAYSDCLDLVSVTIGLSVTEIGNYTFANCRNLTSVYCKMPDPISCNPEFSDEVLSDAVLYVPIGCKPKYETVEPWSGFAHIEEMDYSGIGHAAADCTVRIVANHGVLIVEGLGNGEAVTVYDMNGRTVYWGTAQPVLLQSGSYVVRAGNKTVKVVI